MFTRLEQLSHVYIDVSTFVRDIRHVRQTLHFVSSIRGQLPLVNESFLRRCFSSGNRTILEHGVNRRSYILCDWKSFRSVIQESASASYIFGGSLHILNVANIDISYAQVCVTGDTHITWAR